MTQRGELQHVHVRQLRVSIIQQENLVSFKSKIIVCFSSGKEFVFVLAESHFIPWQLSEGDEEKKKKRGGCHGDVKSLHNEQP